MDTRMEKQVEQQSARGIRSWLCNMFSIEKGELKKVAPLFLLKLFVSIVYCMLTCMKESFIVTEAGSGAEVIPVLKGWVVFPLSIACAVGYVKLSNRFQRSTVFYSIILFFLFIILFYGLVLYPYAEFFTPHHSSSVLTEKLGGRFVHFITVYKYWFHSLFFITAELWGQVVIFILYWGFVNHICQMHEAKRMYILFIAAGDISAIVSGPFVCYHLQHTLPLTHALQVLVLTILFVGILILLTYWWMHRYVLSDVRYFDPAVSQHSLEEKTKLTLSESIKHIFSSKYLLSIAILVVGCGLSINIVEVTWKAHMKSLYPTTEAYMAFSSRVTSMTGVVALITVVFLGGNLFKRFGWGVSAQISPILICSSGILFFFLSYYRDHLAPLFLSWGIAPLTFVVMAGAIQNILCKAVKYSFFDSTKEMAYIPLDLDAKVKGKAAIDVIGSRFGKSSSSFLQVGLMAMIGSSSVLMITPYLIPVLLGVSLYWSYSVKHLSDALDAHAFAEKKPPLQAEPSPTA